MCCSLEDLKKLILACLLIAVTCQGHMVDTLCSSLEGSRPTKGITCAGCTFKFLEAQLLIFNSILMQM